MESQNYKLKIEGVQIFTRKFGLVTEANFTDEIGEYLFKSGQYDKVIEKVQASIETDAKETKTTTPHNKKKLKHGSEKSTGQAN
jgi:hypothetical protein